MRLADAGAENAEIESRKKQVDQLLREARRLRKGL